MALSYALYIRREGLCTPSDCTHNFKRARKLAGYDNDKASSAVHQRRHRHSPLQFDSSDILKSSWVISQRMKFPSSAFSAKQDVGNLTKITARNPREYIHRTDYN